MFDIGDDRVTATPGTWDQTRYVLEADEAIDIDP
jgi:hypothetical protein